MVEVDQKTPTLVEQQIEQELRLQALEEVCFEIRLSAKVEEWVLGQGFG